MRFEHPEALLLVPLLALALRGRLWPRPLLGVLRVLTLVALVVLLAWPRLEGGVDGRDVVLVVDRSRSMPSGAAADARELAAELAQRLRPGDRIGVVGFAAAAEVLSPLGPSLTWPVAQSGAVDADRSDLAAGLRVAAGMVDPGRRATLLVWSDGEVSQEDSVAISRLIARRGLRIDVEPIARSVGRDVAVHELRMPGEVGVDEPFVVNATLVATVATDASWRVLVDGVETGSGTASLRAGRNTVQVQHRLPSPGEHRLAFEVRAPGDGVADNDRGLGVVRGVAPPRVLVVTPGGREDRLTRSLRAVGIDAVVAAPETAPLELGALDGFRAVVLENVPADALPARAMSALETWVRDLGGGLLMTGGARSFGPGGYHRSPVESVLPVTLEIRESQRRFGLAMAICLDRSGSMRATSGSATKMELANRGAAAAIDLLSPIDAVAVFAVDTAPHEVLPLTQVSEDAAELRERVQGIEPGGGGIYVGVAIDAAAEALAGAAQETRHIVVFADAEDAEQPGAYRDRVPELVAQGFTVSVIGLGSDAGRDAKLLNDLAVLGRGRCQFVADAAELPRVFAQETIQVARSSVVEEPTGVRVEPALALLGDVAESMPDLAGYSIAWLRDEAERDLSPIPPPDAPPAHDNPLLAHWYVGLGRSAAFLGEADGALSGAWSEWPGYADLFGTLVRWLSGTTPGDVHVGVRRDGAHAVYELEVPVDRAPLLDDLGGRHVAPDGAIEELVFEEREAGRVEVRVPLRRAGVHRVAVRLGDQTLRLPPSCLPYSPEWQLEPDPRRGEQLLRFLAYRTGGLVSPAIDDVLDGPRDNRAHEPIAHWFAWLALALLLAEIAARRLQVHVALPRRRAVVRAAAAPAAGAEARATEAADATPPAPTAPEPTKADLLSALERAQQRGRRRI